MTRKGLTYVISAPSGAGKTSLCRELLASVPDLELSVSFTTRPMREGERDGVDYHFVDVETFRNMIDAGSFVEWAKVHDNYYGTSLPALEDASRKGRDVLLDIDCQGAAQLKKKIANGVYIFILPPDFDELKHRLEKRNSDSADVVAKRIANARSEIVEAKWYDYIVVNDNFDFALSQLKAILTASTCRPDIVIPAVQGCFDFD